MRTKIQKWGNSLAVRIPRPLATEAKLSAGEPVDLFVENGKLVIALPRKRYQLMDLLTTVTDDNRHEEHDYGTRSGEEHW